jgi:hypothetical protein
MAERVGDDLEVVEIDEEDGDVTHAPAEEAGQALEEELAVGQAGEGIVVGLPRELLFGVLVLGDVDAVADPRLRRAVGTGKLGVTPQPPAASVAVAQLELLTGGREGTPGEVAGQDEVGEAAPRRVGPDALGQHDVGALYETVEVDERHADRGLLKGRPEALLGGGGERAGVLVQPPVHDVDQRDHPDEARMDGGPPPRMGEGGRMVVDRAGIDQAHEPVVQQDEGARQQVREPLLVERQEGDRHEEVEVALDGAVHEMHDHRRGGQQTDGHGGRTDPLRQAVARRDGAGQGDRCGVDRRVPERVAEEEPPGQEHDRVGPHDADHPRVTVPPDLRWQRMAARQSGDESRERSHGRVVGTR